jgi:hypothetical protein
MLPVRFGGGISNMFSPRLLLALVATLLALPAAAGDDDPLALPGATESKPSKSKAKKKKKKQQPAAEPGLGLPGESKPAEPGLALPGEGKAAPAPALDLPPAKPAEKTPPPALSLPGEKPAPALPPPKPPEKQADSKKGFQLGVYKLEHPGQPDDPAFDEIERVLRSIAEASPSVKSSLFMPKPPKGCELEDDACFAALGSFQQLDRVLLGSLTKAENGMAVRIRLIDVAAGKRIAQAEQIVASTDKVEIRAWTESLACKLLVPNGCTGTATIDADLPEMQLLVDQKPIARSGKRPEQITLPVGVHKVRVMVGQRTSVEKSVPVLRENWTPVGLYARQSEDGGLRLMGANEAAKGPDGKPKITASMQTRLGGSSWTKPTGYVLMGLAIIAAGFGGYEQLHAKKLVNDTNAAYDANGGFLKQADLANVSSAKSATTVSRIGFAAGAGLAVAGAVLVFAF